MEAGMNWKDVPHLFCNGKFKLKYPEYHNPITFNPYWYNNLENELNRCTLIARKIDSLTDEEWISQLPDVLKDKADPQYIRQMETDKNSYLRSGKMLLYMLSIGVYPFDQSHFGETVIDINTL